MSNPQRCLAIWQCRTRRFCVAFCLCLFALPADAAEMCHPVIARIVSLQGNVELWKPQAGIWQAARTDIALCPDDIVRVGANSRAALLMANETTLRLNQKSTVMISGLDDKSISFIELLNGAIHVITRTAKPFKIKTPFVNANIEGTEFVMEVDVLAATMNVIEGRVALENQYGRIVLGDGEGGIAEKDQAPRKNIRIKPADAVQWALYYPAVFDAQANDTGSLTFHAGLLLAVGRLDEAGQYIEQALAINARDGQAYALKTIIAVAQNDKQAALDFASQAIALDALSAAAWIARSYAEQANFNLDQALASARKASELEPRNGLAWARLAELEMCSGNQDATLNAARRATEVNPDLAKTRTVLGFTYLTRMQTAAAKAAFEQAIGQDPGDPLARFGFGLAKIRDGDLAAGRGDIAIAVSLDPLDPLLRSYLGKAYFEEKRNQLAAQQFTLARLFDPQDPTPWFYDALRKRTENRPVEALQDLEKSIELNQNRAVYRSQLLLDSDRASRQSSSANIYADLAFERFAVTEAANSLASDPADYSGHRFLADANSRLERHEIASVSELLQAQLLQPINLNPVLPQLAFADLYAPGINGPVTASFNEFNTLFEHNGEQLLLSALGGSFGTLSTEAVVSGLQNRVSYSLGAFHYKSDGFRINDDVENAIQNAYVQYALSPQLNLQAEILHRETEHGDIALTVLPGTYSDQYRRSLDQSSARIGLHWAGSAHADTLFSLIHSTADERQDYDNAGLTVISKDTGYQAEAQQILRYARLNLLAGFGYYRFDVNEDVFGVPNQFQRSRWNAYGYAHFQLASNVIWTLGASYDAYADADFRQQEWNPKLGLQWQITPALKLRAASFMTVKPALYVQQTIEPTIVAGFNQFFDDGNGARARGDAIALDVTATQNLELQLEASRRRLALPILADNAQVDTEAQKETALRLSLAWRISPRLALHGEILAEGFERQSEFLSGPADIRTHTTTLGLRYFYPNGVFASLNATAVWQKVASLNDTALVENTEKFALLDAAFGMRLPGHMASITLTGKNLLDKKFTYQDANFRTPDQQSPPFIPARSILLQLNIAF